MSGFTHELNNLLTVIQGYTELAQEKLPEGSTARQDLDEVMKAADKAITLVAEQSASERGISPSAPQD